MFAQMKSRSRSGPSRADLCEAGGCKCYCHEPVKVLSPLALIGIVIFVMAAWFGFAIWAGKDNQKEYNAHPYICNSVTSTGAPADCHPVTFPPEVEKQRQKLLENQK